MRPLYRWRVKPGREDDFIRCACPALRQAVSAKESVVGQTFGLNLQPQTSSPLRVYFTIRSSDIPLILSLSKDERHVPPTSRSAAAT